jgi:hypothetical protein
MLVIYIIHVSSSFSRHVGICCGRDNSRGMCNVFAGNRHGDGGLIARGRTEQTSNIIRIAEL